MHSNLMRFIKYCIETNNIYEFINYGINLYIRGSSAAPRIIGLVKEL